MDRNEELRRQAEETARKNEAEIPENLEAMSPGQIQRVLHELRVHQIEQEMQNEELRRTQVELDTARARYFDLYDLAPMGYLTVSEKGLILEANLTAANLLGAARSALVRQLLTHFLLEEDQDSYYQFRRQLFATEMPQACELRMVKMNGEVFWAHLAATASQDAGSLAECHLTLSDISERKQAEADLQKSKDLLSETEKTARIGGWEFDVETLTQNWTEEVFRILEIDLPEGEPKVPQGLEFFAPSSRLMAERAVSRAMTLGEPYDQEWEIITTKGNNRWVHAVAKIHREQGKIKRVSGSFQDITERKQAQIQINEQVEELHRWYEATLGRGRVLELKGEVNELLAQAGQPPRYPSAKSEKQ